MDDWAVGSHSTLHAVGQGAYGGLCPLCSRLSLNPSCRRRGHTGGTPVKLKCFAMVWWNAAQAKLRIHQVWRLLHYQTIIGQQLHFILQIRQSTHTTLAEWDASWKWTTQISGNLVNLGAKIVDSQRISVMNTTQDAEDIYAENGSTKKQVSWLKLTLPPQKKKDGTNTSLVCAQSAMLDRTTEQISHSTTQTEVKTASWCASTATKNSTHYKANKTTGKTR